jgi:membrane fusion protein, heavy metal efflux system
MKQSFSGRMTPALAAAVVVVLVTGCHDADEPGHDHEHEEQSHQVTAWSDRFEIFAEFEPVVAERAFTMVTHVTSVETWEPRSEGPIRLMLKRGNEVIDHLENQPAHPGIYLSRLIVDAPGEWEMSIAIPDPDGTSMIELPALPVHADAHDAAHARVPHPPEGVRFLKEQQWMIRLATERVTRRRLVERLVLPAQALSKPGRNAWVMAPVTGQLAGPTGQPFPSPGDRVEAGQVMALLEPMFSDAASRLAELEAEHVQARAALDQAETAFKRVQQLVAEQAKSPRELQEAEVALRTARSRVDAALALQSTYRRPDAESSVDAASLPRMQLWAPIAGIVNRVNAGVGQVVSPDTAVFQLIDPEVLWLETRIPENRIAQLGEPGEALYEKSDALGDFIALEDGAAWFFGLELDPLTRTAPLIFEVPNRDGALRVGQSVRLHLATARAEDAVALPDAAIVEEAGRPVAFVQVSGEIFEKRDLVLGIRDGQWVQVLEGIEEGERAVTQGAYVVRLVSVSSNIPAHGHAH